MWPRHDPFFGRTCHLVARCRSSGSSKLGISGFLLSTQHVRLTSTHTIINWAIIIKYPTALCPYSHLYDKDILDHARLRAMAMSKTGSQRLFHVIIVGASIAGLTLAHCLSSTSIDFTVLEARSDSFSDGAGLAILPNGARILDQLGLYQDVLDQGQCMVSHSTWFEDGRLLRRVGARQIRSLGRYAPIASTGGFD